MSSISNGGANQRQGFALVRMHSGRAYRCLQNARLPKSQATAARPELGGSAEKRELDGADRVLDSLEEADTGDGCGGPCRRDRVQRPSAWRAVSLAQR